jgi:hypothetical protein
MMDMKLKVPAFMPQDKSLVPGLLTDQRGREKLKTQFEEQFMQNGI